MKPLVAMLLLLALATLLLVAQSFQSSFFETTYSPEFSLPVQPAKEQETGGGAPRKNTPIRGATSSNPNGFQGPSGTPHIIGPTAPPPGQ